jgi:hypothetical protein
MEAIIDITRNFKIYVTSGTEILDFDIPGKIVFKRSDTEEVEVLVGDNAEGDYTLAVNKKNFSAFSPRENLKESFATIFDHYFYQTVKQKTAGEDIEKLSIIIPLSFSIPFENLLNHSLKDKCNFKIYRDAEVYTAFYLNESIDLPEIWHFARKDEGSHVYGIISAGNSGDALDSFVLFLINCQEDEPPEIIDFSTVNSKAEIFNTLKILINRHSTVKTKIFYFFEGSDKDIPGMTTHEDVPEDIEIEIEPGKKVTIRQIQKKNRADIPFIKGIYHLRQNHNPATIFHFSPFIQESGTKYSQIIPDKDLNIAIDFPKKVPREFFINFLMGPNDMNLILMERVFVDIGAMMEKHIEFKGVFQRSEQEVKIGLMYKNEINMKSIFPLREIYRIMGD